jgi:hypothetical protein
MFVSPTDKLLGGAGGAGGAGGTLAQPSKRIAANSPNVKAKFLAKVETRDRVDCTRNHIRNIDFSGQSALGDQGVCAGFFLRPNIGISAFGLLAE